MRQIDQTTNYLRAQLRELQNNGQIRALDYFFAEFVFDLQKDHQGKNETLLVSCLAALVSSQLGAGHSCVHLDKLAQTGFWADLPNKSAFPEDCFKVIEILKKSPVVSCEGVTSVAPLCLDGSRLYLYRYWYYEHQVAFHLKALIAQPKKTACLPVLLPLLDALFPKNENNPWPRLAAALALRQGFLLISGGPGTGKTTTVTGILALLCAEAKQAGLKPLIQLAAPTGKAAARLSQSIVAAKAKLNIAPDILLNIPHQAITLHRLLGGLPQSQKFRFNRENPLHLDILLIDEASMIDLPMMCAVLDALPAHAQLILLGDKDQLSSVEPGSVLAELCVHHNDRLNPVVSAFVEQCTGFSPGTDDALAETSLANGLCQLRWSYRFSEASGIARLARSVNAGEDVVYADYPHTENLLEDVVLFPPAQLEHCLAIVLERYLSFIKTCQQNDTEPVRLLEALSSFQVLCATREGRFGVNEINTWMENALRKAGLIRQTDYYAGCPILITQNSHAQQLYNGDVGLVLTDPDNKNELCVYFPPQDVGQNQTPRQFFLSRLPGHEKVYAMTVHKSQGSEFDEVVILYPEQDNPVLSRELLYTAITRARKRCRILADPRLLNASIKRKTRRDSGLAIMLEKPF